MDLAIDRTQANGFKGLMWAFESQLYSGSYATADDYQVRIQIVESQRRVYVPIFSSRR
jgi:hypothetical protein